MKAFSCRPAGAYWFYDARKWLLLWLLPLLRSLIAPQDILWILAASLRDILIAGLFMAYSVAKWRYSRYTIYPREDGSYRLLLTQGLLLRRSLRLSAEDAASMEWECTPLLRLLRTRRVRINTAGLKHRSDATLYLPAEQAGQLSGTVDRYRRYTTRFWPVLVTAASGSNAAIGLLTFVPVLRRISHLVGEQTPVWGVVGRIVSLGLPPALETLANIFLIGWATAFLRTFLRFTGFYAMREGARLRLCSGLFTRRQVLIDCHKITALELRQSLFMKLCGLHTVTITAAGYGRGRGLRPVLVPAAGAKEVGHALDLLMHDYPVCTPLVRPAARSWKRYVSAPLIVSVGGIACLFPVRGIPQTAAFLLIVGGLWWLTIRLFAFRRAGFGISPSADAICLRYSRGLALYELHLPRQSVDSITLTRPFLRPNATTCTVHIRCFDEKRRRYRVWSLPYAEARALAERFALQSGSRLL